MIMIRKEDPMEMMKCLVRKRKRKKEKREREGKNKIRGKREIYIDMVTTQV